MVMTMPFENLWQSSHPDQVDAHTARGAAGAEVRARAAGFRRGGVCAVCVRGVGDKQARRARSQARKGEAFACAPGPRGRARVVRAQNFGSASRCRREVGPGASRRLASRRGASPQARALPPLTHSRAPSALICEQSWPRRNRRRKRRRRRRPFRCWTAAATRWSHLSSMRRMPLWASWSGRVGCEGEGEGRARGGGQAVGVRTSSQRFVRACV